MEYAKKRLVVAGGAGFLGTNLCEELLRRGAEVVCIDSFKTGRRHNLEGILSESRFELIEADVVDDQSYMDLPELNDKPIDGIFNLACPASPPHYQADPVHTFRSSIWGNWNLAQLALRHSARMLFASTSEVYGDPEVHPQPESYWGNVNPIGIRSCYDEGKRGGETLLMDLSRRDGLDLRIVRIFNTYGPKMDYLDGRVVSNFIIQGLRKEALTLYGDGSQTRSFCFVDDLIDGILRLYEGGDEVAARPINLGNPGEFTLKELGTEIEKLLGEQLHYEYHPLPADDPKRRKPAIDLAQELLGWQPVTSLEDGLRKTIDYFREELRDATGF